MQLHTLTAQHVNNNTSAQLHYEQFTINDGLPGNSINSVMQDSKGFIWLATASGLARYDGHRFKTIRYNHNDSNGIKGNFIIRLQEDKENNIWVCQHAGLSKLNTRTWQAENYFFADSLTGKKYDWEVFQVYEGKDITLVGSSKGLRQLDKKTNLLLPVRKYPLSDSINHFGTAAIQDYDDKTLVIGSWRGLVIMDKATGNYKRYHYPPTNDPKWEAPGIITCLYIDDDKGIWTGWWGGALTRFDINTKAFETFAPTVDEKKLKWLIAYDIKPSNNKNELYITDRYQNVYLFNKETKEWQTITPTALKGTNATYQGILKDKAGILWLATSDGLFKSDPRQFLVETFNINAPKTPGADNGVSAICRDEADKKKIWLSGFNAGNIFLYDLSLKKNIPLPAAMIPLQNQLWEYYQGYVRDNENNLWINSGNGLYKYNEQSKKLISLRANKKDSLALPYGHGEMLKTKKGKIFVAQEDGLYYYNYKTKAFKNLFTQNISRQIKDFNEDDGGKIWAVMVEQPNIPAAFGKIDANTFAYTTYSHPVIDKCIYGTGRAMRCVYVKNEQYVYIGTSFGLFRGSIQKGKLELVQATAKEGFFASEMHDIKPENDSIIWLRTADGLYRHNMYANSYTRFSVQNGLLNNFVNSINAYDGEVFLGYQDANFQRLNTYFFSTLRPPAVYITGFKVYGNDFLYDGEDVMQHDKINISYKQDNIRFEFAALDYTNTAYQLFKYKLEDYDKDWVVTNEPFANYNNLRGGNFVFKIKAANSYGLWNEEGDTLQLYVKPPFWETVWFKILCAGLIIGIAFWIYKRRIAAIRRAALLKQQRTEAELKALRSQMNPHFIFNCMNTIDAFILKNKRTEASEVLQQFSLLTRSILENAREETILLDKEAQTLENYIALEQTVMEHKFQYTFEVDKALLQKDLHIPTMLLQPYIENAIVHGLKYKEGIDGLLVVALTKENEYLHCSISDNGIGREASALKQAAMAGKRKSYGMKVTAERITVLNEGGSQKIWVNINDLPQGTKVELRIPLIERW